MAKKSLKRQPAPDPAPEPAPAIRKPTPISLKKEPLPPEVAKRASKFFQDSREIEMSIWRSING